MKWKYHIPHLWKEPRTLWEDIWLKPDAANYADPSIWLTIDALGDISDSTQRPDQVNWQKIALAKLGNRNYWIEAGDMIVRAEDFNKEEFLDWTRIWLRETGFEVTEIVECSRTEFANSNDHATQIALLLKS